SPFKQKTAYEIGLGIPAEPLFRSKDLKLGPLQLTVLQEVVPQDRKSVV
ncbi:unnamed protein product, partial [marine sediment metagenome]